MNRDQIREELKEILAVVDEGLRERVEVREETPIREGLGLDSLQVTEVLFEIEERMDVKIADEEARDLKTVGDLITLVEAKARQGGQAPSE